MTLIVSRSAPDGVVTALTGDGVSPLMARLFAARGIEHASQLDAGLARLIPFSRLRNAEAMARRLADAIARRERLLVVADYDADGATACALAVKGLRAFGATVDFIVPNRFEFAEAFPEVPCDRASIDDYLHFILKGNN